MNSSHIRTGLTFLIAVALNAVASVTHAETYQYDSTGRLTRVVHDDGTFIAYTYDDNGNILARTAGSEGEGEGEGESESEGDVQPPYGPQAAIASTTGSLSGIRDIRDLWLSRTHGGDSLMSVYYSSEAERTVRITLASAIKTTLTSEAIYKPVTFLLSMDFSLKVVMLLALVGIPALLGRKSIYDRS